MLFSSPDYPLFLIAVFFLYALARWGGVAWNRPSSGAPRLVRLLYAVVRWVGAWVAPWARFAVMVLLGDVIFMLVAKDPDTLWDPIGGALIRLAIGELRWSPVMAWHWVAGAAVLGGAVVIGRHYGGRIASERGQAWIARGIVAVLAAIGATVAIAWHAGTLDETTAAITAHGHLVVLVVLGIGLGASQVEAYRPLGRIVLLFFASALFYHAWAAEMPGPYRYLLALLLGTIVLDYYLGLWIERAEAPGRRKALVIVSLCSNLGILFFFKYADFFTHDVLHLRVSRLHLILPAGISFHTFQSLSYTIDVYRKQLRATRSVIQFATFVLFFPQLVAGPIVRAQDLLPQLAELPALELERASAGLFRIVVGLFKKIALADTLALALVDRVFEAPERFSAVEVVAGVYAYALQIYLDFSAYSDIAIGSAQVLGFTLPENFRTPYRSANLQEFWRRWHISLSTWLRDYLYITLGGNQGAPWWTYIKRIATRVIGVLARVAKLFGSPRDGSRAVVAASPGTQWWTYANLIVTMVLGGLWHGASWAFIVWGALHGLGLAVTRYFQRSTANDDRAAWRLFGKCVVIAAVGAALQRSVLRDAGTWPQLVVIWLYLTPLWAVLTAWLSREAPARRESAALVAGEGLPWRALFRRSPELVGEATRISWTPELLRLGMCFAGIECFCALEWSPRWTWLPLVGLTWGLGLAADVAERGLAELGPRLWFYARRALSVVLVFQYVCLAWIFFRATSFDNALAVLRQIATLETDHANLVPIVRLALVVGFACHFFADGSLRWLRMRFVALPPLAQGIVLAAVALVLRELGHTKIVPFIYFQF